MSPPPSAMDDRRLGMGSPVTTTMCGSLPRRFRIRLRASEREFCERSLRIVSLQEILAWSSGAPPFVLRRLERNATESSTSVPARLISSFSHKLAEDNDIWFDDVIVSKRGR